jgi:hypothetical protein
LGDRETVAKLVAGIVVHPSPIWVIRYTLAEYRLFPVYLQLQTCRYVAATDVKGQKRTYDQDALFSNAAAAFSASYGNIHAAADIHSPNFSARSEALSLADR